MAERNEMYAKLLTQEGEALDRAAVQLETECALPADFLGAACALLHRRQRYFSMAGEHGSAYDIDGIGFVDALDERLLVALDRVLAARKAGEMPAEAGKRLLGILPGLPSLPPHPVGYMVIYLLTKAFAAFEEGTRETPPAELAGLEQALTEKVAEWVHAFVHTRMTPLVRHMSDVSREYTVVARLSCACGKGRYAVQRQSLRALPDGSHTDALAMKCASCGAEREIEFLLPHFGDIAKTMGEGKGKAR